MWDVVGVFLPWEEPVFKGTGSTGRENGCLSPAVPASKTSPSDADDWGSRLKASGK